MKILGTLILCLFLFLAIFASVVLSVFSTIELYFVTNNIPLSVIAGLWVFAISEYTRRKITDHIVDHFATKGI